MNSHLSFFKMGYADERTNGVKGKADLLQFLAIDKGKPKLEIEKMPSVLIQDVTSDFHDAIILVNLLFMVS